MVTNAMDLILRSTGVLKREIKTREQDRNTNSDVSSGRTGRSRACLKDGARAAWRMWS